MDDTPINQILTERRSRLRARLAGAPLAEIADRSGITRQTLWRIREGHVKPDADTIDAVELALRRFGDAVEAP